ncbi:uncharacterized protein N7511_003184 [Penicillium nucicola]|uniref:uncharacterized protein n=1 Tax=Penicillium nucicola TaxID=1850975 RepID=UPI0025454B76|nr:uncharacterized protein N7511_003184 [Penicillium nucicola]KAJ5771133.1 hypothetical protein N7511_003184 [Penicillium nucicola]
MTPAYPSAHKQGTKSAHQMKSWGENPISAIGSPTQIPALADDRDRNYEYVHIIGPGYWSIQTMRCTRVGMREL